MTLNQHSCTNSTNSLMYTSTQSGGVPVRWCFECWWVIVVV